MLCPRSTQRIVFAFALATLQLSLCSSAQGQGAPPAARAVPTAKPQPTKEKEQDYSQEGFVIEKLQTMFRFEKDGTGRREVRLRARVQSEAGMQGFGQLDSLTAQETKNSKSRTSVCISQMARW
jgi:hypothetical protein